MVMKTEEGGREGGQQGGNEKTKHFKGGGLKIKICRGKGFQGGGKALLE